ncbi:hypothetical protein OROMI_000469 [Orobanche minor]
MASKTVLIVLACFLLINTKVSSAMKEEFLTEGITLAPTSNPLIYMSSPPPPSSSPLVATTPPPSLPPVVKAPPPHSAVIMTPPPPPAPPISMLAPPPVVKPPRNKEECIPLCDVRCKNHSRKNTCSRACLTCCERCKCVPSGQYGNKETCGTCYARMTTRGGKLKCP